MREGNGDFEDIGATLPSRVGTVSGRAALGQRASRPLRGRCSLLPLSGRAVAPRPPHLLKKTPPKKELCAARENVIYSSHENLYGTNGSQFDEARLL